MNTCWVDLYFEIKGRFSSMHGKAYQQMKEPLASIMKACEQDLHRLTVDEKKWTDQNIKQAVYYGCGYASGFQDQPRLPEEEREKAYAGFMKVVSALPSLLNEPHEP